MTVHINKREHHPLSGSMVQQSLDIYHGKSHGVVTGKSGHFSKMRASEH